MFCPHCGNQVPDGTAFCPHCGAQLQQTQAGSSQNQPPLWNESSSDSSQQPQQQPVQYVVQSQNASTTQQPEDSGSFGWAVLGFFIPLVGLILWLVWKNEKPQSGKMAGIGALVGFILGILFSMMGGCAALMV